MNFHYPLIFISVKIVNAFVGSRTLRIITFLNLQLVVIRPFTMLILFLLWVDNKFLLTDHVSY